MMSSKGKDADLEEAKKLMAALVRQPPKLHDEMKLGNKKPAQEQAEPKPTRAAPGTSPGTKR